jgi:hypothetical protein
MKRGTEKISSLDELVEAAKEEVIVTQLSNLDEYILESNYGIEVVDGVREFCLLYESPEYVFDSDVIVQDSSSELSLKRELTTYSPPDMRRVEYEGSAYTTDLNRRVSEDELSWEEIGKKTLRQSEVADEVVSKGETADVIALVIVDGLSYSDWTGSGYDATPVYADCPTITECGYPNVVYGGQEGTHIATKLHRKNFKNRLGFTYWEKEEEELTEYLHKPFSPNDVIGDIQDFDDVISYLNQNDWYSDGPTYIQITLTGPERVAHKLKEDPNVQSEVKSIKDKLEKLGDVLSSDVSNHRTFATSDHGILWRMELENDVEVLEGDWNHNKRRCIESPERTLELPYDEGEHQVWKDTKYFRLYYPYLFHSLRSNEPGTHGGFSYQESIVPLIQIG